MKKLLCSLLATAAFAFTCTSAFAQAPSQSITPRSVRDPFNFNLKVDTDDDNAMTGFALRDKGTFGGGPAFIGFSSLMNAAHSMHFKVLKWNPYSGTISGTASDTVTPNTDFEDAIYASYNSTYANVDGTYTLYAWTSVKDCSAAGQWTP